MKIDSPKLISAIKKSDYGTGTLSTKLNISPDTLHKVIATGECAQPLFITLCKILDMEIAVIKPQTDEPVQEITEPPAQQEVLQELEQETENHSDIMPEVDETINETVSFTDAERSQADALRATYGVHKLRQMVAKGEADAQLLLFAEQQQESPRVSLTQWLISRINRINGNCKTNQSSQNSNK